MSRRRPAEGSHLNTPGTHVVLQTLDHLDAVVAQVELLQTDQVLQTLQFGDPIALQTDV